MGVEMKYSQYESPIILTATLHIKRLLADKKYDPDKSRVGKAEELEFTNEYERLMNIIRAEENRINYEFGYWKEGRGFRTD